MLDTLFKNSTFPFKEIHYPHINSLFIFFYTSLIFPTFSVLFLSHTYNFVNFLPSQPLLHLNVCAEIKT